MMYRDGLTPLCTMDALAHDPTRGSNTPEAVCICHMVTPSTIHDTWSLLLAESSRKAREVMGLPGGDEMQNGQDRGRLLTETSIQNIMLPLARPEKPPGRVKYR